MTVSVLIGVMLAVGLAALPACKQSRGNDPHARTPSQKPQYHCPMHPSYVSDKPGDCPICGMRLIPINSQGERNEQPPATPVPGRATVMVPSDREQLIGVRTATVSKRELTVLVRASGRVAYDPELYSAIAEYQEALNANEKIKDNPWPDVRERAEALMNASQLRLRQLGLSEAQIEELSKTSQRPTNLLLGQPGESVWVYAQIYEYESGLVRAGQAMEVISSAFPGRRFLGTVRAVDPIFNSETRSLRLRAEVPNPDGLLKPEMYIDAVIHVSLGSKLAIPEEALMDTGTRQLAFVMKGQGRYEPREIRVGHEAEGYFEVVSGLNEGEQVVASANFLIDSESKLKAALSESGAGGHQHGK
ncbi:MAG: efflux RND transporter periplasmic adaptor subunit [Elusimicrobia bacterium]|nr:efflux RND transporter periplasmic adaptor subunit [Elusimicrobiota bacterium]